MCAGMLMVVISVTTPPQLEQAPISIPKIRLSNWAQLKRADLEAEEFFLEANGSGGFGGDNLRSKGHVGCRQVMKPNQMKPRRRDKGREALQKFQGGHDNMGCAIAVQNILGQSAKLATPSVNCLG